MRPRLVRDAPLLRAALRGLEAQTPPERMVFGLERMREAAERLGLLPFPVPALVVGGTNGKGSVAALLASILTASGRRTGLYTSPHLHAWRERIVLDGRPLPSPLLIECLLRVRALSEDLPLTYFETTTLVALDAYRRLGVEVVVLEVGLGGRLDAVNVLDGLASAVVSVDLDHCEWLGPDRESIGREKAGIFRPGRPAIIGDLDPPSSLVTEATRRGADPWRQGRDFAAVTTAGDSRWTYRGRRWRFEGLVPPALAGSFQRHNAAVAIALLESVKDELPVERRAIEEGLREVHLAGRLEMVGEDGREIIFDVAHNPAAARTLAAELAAMERRRPTLLVLGMFADKDVAGFVRPLVPLVDGVVVLGLPPPRGLSPRALVERLASTGLPSPVDSLREGTAALAAAWSQVPPGGRILVTGSFRTVAAVRAAWIRRFAKSSLARRV